MATRTWNSAGSTDMNNTANYDGSGSFASDDLVFNNTSVVNAAATAGITCNSITIASNYTGTWSLSGQTATLAQGFSDDGITGAHNYGNGITCNGASATFHVGSGVGTITASSCAISMNGTTAMVLDDDKGILAKSLTLGASAIVTNSGIAPTTYSDSSTPVSFGNSSTFTNNQLIEIRTTGNITVFSFGTSVTFNGNASGNYRLRATGANDVQTIPAITYTGSGTWTLAASHLGNSSSHTLSGTFNIGANTLIIANDAGGTHTFNANNQNVTCGIFRPGAVNTVTVTCNMGSGTITISSFDGTTTNPTYSSGGTNVNFQTSQWVCTGAFSFGSNHTVDAGTSLVTFSGTAAQTITSNDKSFYDVSINRTTAGTCTFAGTTSLHTLTVSATNTQAVSWTGTTMTVSGNLTLDGSGTLNCGNGITMNGDGSTLWLKSTLGVWTNYNCVITFNNNVEFKVDKNDSNGFKQAVIATNKTLTISGSATYVYFGYTSTSAIITCNNNSTITNNINLLFYLSASVSLYSVGSNVTLNGSGNISVECSFSGTLTVPSITYTGSGYWEFKSTANSAVVSLSGTFSLGTNTLLLYSSSQSLTFNTNNNQISCGIIRLGSNIAGKDFTANLGSSSISCTQLDGSLYNKVSTQNINLQTSQITCSGNWTFGSNHTITGLTTSSVTFTNTATITSNGKVFPGAVILNAAGKTFTLADNMSIAGNLTITAGTLAGAFTTTSAGNVTVMVNTTFNRLILTKVTTRRVTVNAGVTLTLTNLTNTNVNGAAGALTEWRSFVPGVTYNLSIPAPITLQYQNPQDNVASALITADDYTSMNGGNDTNWKFAPAGASGYFKYW